MPEHYDVTLLDPDNKLGRDIAIIFSTAIITTLLEWWFLVDKIIRMVPSACQRFCGFWPRTKGTKR
jgi:hypothetical protein